MNTDELIRALAADRRRRPAAAGLVARWLPVAIGLSALVLVAGLGLRPGLADALMASPRPAFKILASLMLGLVGVGLALRLGRPGGSSSGWRGALIAIAGLFVTAVVLELWALAPGDWRASTLGTNAAECLMLIPALALAPLAVALAALRVGGAPERPAKAGAAAGLMAGGFAAALYALHCPDDSPLFVATWYGLAIAAVTAAGAAAGSRLLRW